MVWLWIWVGGLLDVVWAICLKLSHGFTRPAFSIATVICLIASYWLYAKSSRQLPIGTVYAVFTGVAAVGTVLTGILFLGEPAGWLRIGFILLLVLGLMGLKREDAEERKKNHSATRQRED